MIVMCVCVYLTIGDSNMCCSVIIVMSVSLAARATLPFSYSRLLMCFLSCYQPYSTLPPPPPPPPMPDDVIVDENEALCSMLLAWYMSGYHTGYYQVGTRILVAFP